MLPVFKSDDQSLMLMQTQWGSEINPILKNPIVSGNLLKQISLIVGTNTINHKLGKKLQGWIVVGQNASATFYDAQSGNSMPDKTLILVSSAVVTINLYVF